MTEEFILLAGDLTIDNENSNTLLEGNITIENDDNNVLLEGDLNIDRDNTDISLEGNLDISNEEFGYELQSQLTVENKVLNTLLEVDANIESENYDLDIDSSINVVLPYTHYLDGTTNIEGNEFIKNIPSSIEAVQALVKYIGVITGYIDVTKELVRKDIYSTLKATRVEGVVTYIGHITGNISIEDQDFGDEDFYIPSSLDVPKVSFNRIINAALFVDYDKLNKIINGTVDIDRETYNELLEGTFYYEMGNTYVDIVSTLNAVETSMTDLDGSVDIQLEEFNHEFESSIEVKDVFISADLFDGSVTMDDYAYKSKDLWVNFEYTRELFNPEDESNVLTGKISLYAWNTKYDINSRLRVPCHRILYTFLSKLKAVRGINYDILSGMTVSGDHVYDLDAEVNLEYQDFEDEALLEGKLTIEPHDWIDLVTILHLDKTDTRRDIESSMFVVNPVDKEFASTITVKNPYRRYNKDIFSSIMRVGNEYTMSFESSMDVEAALQDTVDIVSSMEVTNSLMPGRVVFFVDPLWQYEPYVLKNAVSTFFERIYLTTYLTVVYGGSPRANWDIKHFCGVYRIADNRQIEVPFDFYPGNPLASKNSMVRFVHRMFMFKPHDPHKQVDNVFVFSNNPYAHNSTYLNPLFEACDRYRIPITVITSRGEFVGTDPASGRYINRTTVDHNLPLDAQPHWQYGAGTKHRDIYDDRPVV